LQARCNVRCLPERQRLLARPRPHIAHHDHAGMHPQPHGHPVLRGQGEPRIQRLEGLQQPKPGADGPLGVIFMCHGVAKIHQHAIAQVLGHIAIKALHHLGTGLVVGADNLAVVFRVQVPRQSGRVHQITEQHREAAAFRVRQRQGTWEQCSTRMGGRCQCIRQRGGGRLRWLYR
jgi:hypothetical protein